MNAILQKRIEQGTAHRKSRDENANFVLNNSQFLPDLVAIACNSNDKNHYKALWVIELISIQKPEVLIPYINSFCATLSHYKIEKAIRPSAKICFQLAKSKKVTLTQEQEDQIIETCLDWLINNVKVAPAAFAMRTLYLLSNFGHTRHSG
jgi:hypothetical protein